MPKLTNKVAATVIGAALTVGLVSGTASARSTHAREQAKASTASAVEQPEPDGLGCRGLSPASATGCPPGVIEAALSRR
jgi:hypothetical protein